MAGTRIQHELLELRLGQLNLPEPAVRTQDEPEALDALARSIDEVGLITPVIVRPLGDSEYAVIAGGRRVQALRRSGAGAQATVTCLVVGVSDQQATLLELAENLMRRPLSSFDVARTYRVLAADFGMSQSAIARAVGTSQPGVSQALAVFDLDREVLDALATGRIGMGVAYELLPLEAEPEKQRAVLAQVLQAGLGAGGAAALVASELHGAAAEPPREVDVDGAGRFRVRTMRRGRLKVVIDAADRRALGKLLTAVRKELLGGR